MADPFDTLVGRLEGVRRLGPDRVMAKSPLRPKQRTGSVSVRRLADGRVLIHDFAGASPDEIVRAVGLDLADLFPPRQDDDRRPQRVRRAFLARDAILALRRELLVAWLILADVAAGKSLTDQDRKRAGIARARCVALITELSDE